MEPKHVEAGTYCSKCLRPTDLAEFLANDHLCNACNEAGESYPLASPNHFDETAAREAGAADRCDAKRPE